MSAARVHAIAIIVDAHALQDERRRRDLRGARYELADVLAEAGLDLTDCTFSPRAHFNARRPWADEFAIVVMDPAARNPWLPTCEVGQLMAMVTLAELTALAARARAAGGVPCSPAPAPQAPPRTEPPAPLS
jgi:hypothetical protein